MEHLPLQSARQAAILAHKLEVLKLPATINQSNLSIEFQSQDKFIISKMVDNLKSEDK